MTFVVDNYLEGIFGCKIFDALKECDFFCLFLVLVAQTENVCVETDPLVMEGL